MTLLAAYLPFFESTNWTIYALLALSVAIHVTLLPTLIGPMANLKNALTVSNWDQWKETADKKRETLGHFLFGQINRNSAAHGESIHQLIENINQWFRQRLLLAKCFVALAPLLGLIGTVEGMMTTFGGLAFIKISSMDLVSEGISAALITTQTGLLIALEGLLLTTSSNRILKNIEERLRLLDHHLNLTD